MSEVVAYLEAPIVGTYHTYAEYLQDFRHFLEFLDKNPRVASAQTLKRPNQPSRDSLDTTIGRVKARLNKPFSKETLEDDSDSSFTNIRVGSAASTTSQAVIAAEPKKAAANPIVARDTGTDAFGNKLSTVVTHAQLGKRAAMKRLKEVCSDGLAIALVEKNLVSRYPEHFDKMFNALVRAKDRKGRKLGQDDVKLTKFAQPGPDNSLEAGTNWMELWNSTPEVSD